MSIAQFRLFAASLRDCEFARHYQSERQENNFHSDDMTDDFMNGERWVGRREKLHAKRKNYIDQNYGGKAESSSNCW